MARAFGDVTLRRFTVEEYHRMAETGILGPDERVELVRGAIRQMSPKHRAHVIAVDQIASLLRDALRARRVSIRKRRSSRRGSIPSPSRT